jgi:TolB-like protein/Flp pilus assembly protein TadD
LRFLFGDYVLDTARRELSRGGQQVALEPQVFDLLVYLLKSRERVVSKDDLLASVWGGRIVSDATLDSRITAARRVVGDSGAAQTLIRTFPRRGVRFVGEVREEAKSAALAPEMVAEQGRPVTWCAASPRPRLSIVVLPFSNFSADRDQDYFADGITDDLTTDLSRIADSFVIARRTAFTYKGKAVDVRQIGRELGVRYALEGSIRRSGRHVRANTQLIDTDTGAHLWAERFDHDACDLLALQDEITSRIAFALNLELVAAEVTRPTDYPDALDCILRGRAALSKPLSRDTYAEGICQFEHALALDPQAVDAQSWLAHTLAGRKHFQMTVSPAADLERAEVLVRRALVASPRRPLVHLAKGMLLHARGDPEQAIPEYETVIASNRNWVNVLYTLGMCKLLVGSIEETTPLVEQAIRFSPRDPFIANWYMLIGTVDLLKSRTDEAVCWLEKALSVNPGLAFAHGHLAAAHALNGDAERAAAELAEARRLSGDGRFASIARLQAARSWGVPKIRALYETTYFVGLRKAGMPE